MGNIDQLLCTHCTYGTSFLHQSKSHLKDQVFEYSARAGSVDPAQSHDFFRRIEPFLNYRLPIDAPNSALVEHDARSLPKRLVYLPSSNGLCVVGQVSYRRYDVTRRRAGAYFAHVLLEMVGDTRRGPQGRPSPPSLPNAKSDSRTTVAPKPMLEWSAREAAQMWGWPKWIEEDDTEPNAKPFLHVSDRFVKLPTPAAQPESWETLDPMLRVGDKALTAFLQADLEQFPSWIPKRWKSVPAKIRQQLLVELIHGFLKLNVAARDCFLIGVEPSLAALLFYGVARMIPRRGPAEQLSFSTCEPQNARPPFALAATYSYLGTSFALSDDPRICTLSLNTFQSGWESTRTARNQGLAETSYAQVIVNLYLAKGPSAIDRFLAPIDDESVYPQPPTAADLVEVLAAETYGQWVIGARKATGKPTPPTSKSGKRHVASIIRAAMPALEGHRLQDSARWRPLLLSLAEDDLPVPASGATEQLERKRLIDDILIRIGDHPAETEACLKPLAHPDEWQVQLVLQLMQSGKTLPSGIDDFWRGRFSDARLGRQKWLEILARQLVTQQGAAGLRFLLQQYETWESAQPDSANDARIQSRTCVLQLLCNVAANSNSPAPLASTLVMQVVNQLLEKNPRWHAQLLNRTYWSREQARELLNVYVAGAFNVAGTTAAESRLAVRLRRDLRIFPCLPQGTKPPSDIDGWLDFLEVADAALQLRSSTQIAAWKQLRKLLSDLAEHWAVKPTGLKAKFGTADWDARTNTLGTSICSAFFAATTPEPVGDDKSPSRWKRLTTFQQLVNSSFQWSKQAEDIDLALYSKEVARNIDRPVNWNPQWNQTPGRKKGDPFQINRAIVAAAAATIVLMPLSLWLLTSWLAGPDISLTDTAGRKAHDSENVDAENSNQPPPASDRKPISDTNRNTKTHTLTSDDLAIYAKAICDQFLKSNDSKPDLPKLNAKLKDVLRDQFRASHTSVVRHIVSPHGTDRTRIENIKDARRDWAEGGSHASQLPDLFDYLINGTDDGFRRAIALTIASQAEVCQIVKPADEVQLNAVWLAKNLPAFPKLSSMSDKSREDLNRAFISQLCIQVPAHFKSSLALAPFRSNAASSYVQQLLDHETSTVESLRQKREAAIGNAGNARFEPLGTSGDCDIPLKYTITGFALHGIRAVNEELSKTGVTVGETKLTLGEIKWNHPATPSEWRKRTVDEFSLLAETTNDSVLDIRISHSEIGDTVSLKVPANELARTALPFTRLLLLETVGTDDTHGVHLNWINLYDGQPTILATNEEIGISQRERQAADSIFDIWKVQFADKGVATLFVDNAPVSVKFSERDPEWDCNQFVSRFFGASLKSATARMKMEVPPGLSHFSLEIKLEESAEERLLNGEKAAIEKLLKSIPTESQIADSLIINNNWSQTFNNEVNKIDTAFVRGDRPRIHPVDLSKAISIEEQKAVVGKITLDLGYRLKDVQTRLGYMECQDNERISIINGNPVRIALNCCRRVADSERNDENWIPVPVWNLGGSSGKK